MKSTSEAPSDKQDWRKKYYDSLSSLEGEQRRFAGMESSLKRLVTRLCTASLGQSPQLDEQIKKLQAVVRRDSTNDELDKLAAALTDAIAKLDTASSSATRVVEKKIETSNDTIADDEQIRSILASLLAELRRDPTLLIKVDALDAKLATSLTRDRLATLMASLSELVAQRIQRIERAKQEVEVLLSHMVGRLDEISRFVADQSQNQTQTLASSESLNTQLVGEMKAIGASVAAAVDLDHIRAQVRNRIDSIGRHLQEFREREVARANAMRARNEQMQARVSELEAEANRLHTQLKDEQRLSTMDVLTNIPNRLAYEKRMEEELKRWQRFKQPTCLAAWDIDHFKRVNDTYGHSAGDRILRAVAEHLASRIRSTDFFARFGGEEFVMLLCGTKMEDAMRVLDEMRTAIATLKFHSQGTPIPVTISCGVTALLPNDSAAAAFDRADKALYQAKERGRNCCVSG